MASRRVDEPEGLPPRKKRAPATTPEARENQLVSLAMDVAEEQLRNGQASSQLITHFAKLASSRERLEQERLKNENELLRKKISDMDTAVQVKDLMAEALKAFRGYSGNPDPEEEEEYYE